MKNEYTVPGTRKSLESNGTVNMGHSTHSWALKVQKYDEGKYLIPVPPVVTTTWTKADWIRYIDEYGMWI